MTGGITYSEWVGLDQHAGRLMARDSELRPLTLRIMFAAIGWSNLIGHAEFAIGGLAGILTTTNPKTGEIHIPSRQQVTNEIRRAKAMGLIGECSDVRCLVAPEWWEKAGGKGGKTCRHHKLGQRYVDRVAARSETPEVSRVAANDTPGVSLVHTRSVAVSGERPISDSVLNLTPDQRRPA